MTALLHPSVLGLPARPSLQTSAKATDGRGDPGSCVNDGDVWSRRGVQA